MLDLDLDWQNRLVLTDVADPKSPDIYAKVVLGSKPHRGPKLAGQEAEASGLKSRG